MLTLTEKNIHTGNLILVNEHYGIREELTDFLIPVQEEFPEILLQKCAAVLLNELMQEIHGWRSIVPVSGYRSLAEQQHIWEDSLRENGPDFTRKYVAVPGHSEHQTGLAVDLGLKQETIDFIRPDFPYTGVCRTFRKKAAKYGFILRYPFGKESITGISHEPWHFRYVGIPHAEIMEKNDLTLEEYVEFVKRFPYDGSRYTIQNGSRKICVSYLAARPERGTSDRESFPKNAAGEAGEFPDGLSCACTVSGNNIDGYIITEWEEL
ncbi:MAG: M15 family metallopeptidase [Butyrivibrio sp.]|nr:M15 family metallopeptidase [Acetatifactor muris]MCM1558732.1 M15 family metallopeptidase [Butyrivibrio sp.]